MAIIRGYDEETKNSTSADYTHNVVILYIQFTLSLVEIIIIIFGICYVFCMLWIVLGEFVEDFILDVNYKSLVKTDSNYGVIT
jgi:hypothetical protein